MMLEGETSLGDTQDRFRILAERLPQLVWTALPNGRHDWFNQRCQEYTGFSLPELKENWKSCIHPDDIERAKSAWYHAVQSGSSYEIEYRVKGRDHVFRRFLVRALPMLGAQGQIIRWFGTCTDLSTIAVPGRLGERSGQSEKMEAMGHLTGSVIHDFNNLLTAILGNLELITMRGPDDAIKRLAGNAIEAARRGVTLTSQLLAFTRAQSVEIVPVDINALVSGMDDLLRRSLGDSIELELRLAPDLPPATGNANQLELAILNLAINARDAMSGKGKLTVTTRVDTDAGAPQVVVTVTDNGSGMSPEILDRAFEPFFTTKETGKGTGLGLAQVRSIARQCGGNASISSTVGIGTTVSLELPVTSEYLVSPFEISAPALLQRGSSEIVLVIDDDMDVRRYMVESLSALSYIVIEAPDGPSGLRLLDDSCPDLLIVDYAMPGITGLQVIEAASEKCPDMPVILISGVSESQILFNDRPEVTVLPKPFRVAELSQAVANALAAAAFRKGSIASMQSSHVSRHASA